MIDSMMLQSAKNEFEKLNIPVMYDKFPSGFRMDINGWSFPDYADKITIDVELNPDELTELKVNGLPESSEAVPGQTYRIKRLMTMDIELGPDEVVDQMNHLRTRHSQREFSDAGGSTDMKALKKAFAQLYQKTCTQRCPHCFNQEDDFYIRSIINGQNMMKFEHVLDYIRQAKKFGLESVKYLGIGEIFKNPRLFDILDVLKAENIIFAIFTKGTALGSDAIARQCGYRGVEKAEDLVKRLCGYENVSILLGANSFRSAIQDEMIGCQMEGCISGYTQIRNRALELLVNYGFNDPDKGKRLALIAAPVTPLVSDETIEMYEWAARRNIAVVTIPTMVSGKGAGELEWLFAQFESSQQLVQRYDPERKMKREERYTEWVVDFYTDIYTRAIEIGITDFEAVKADGLSGYAGGAKCQQMRNGMYLRLQGTLQECPGRCVGAIIEDDVRKKGLLRSWVDSINYKRNDDCRVLCSVKMKDLTNSGVTPCDCCKIYDNVGSMPPELEMRVMENLAEKFAGALFSAPKAAPETEICGRV